MTLTAPLPGSAPLARHAATVRRPRLRPVLLAVLLVLVAAAATGTALRLHAGPDPVGTALDRLRAWPSVTVDGYLTGPVEPTHLVATITADGAAHGDARRSLDARAEFAVGAGGPLLRGNRQWWSAEPPAQAAQLADRWVRDAHDAAVAQVAQQRLTPAVLSEELVGLRNPAGRTSAHVVVDGVPGTAFVGGGARLVVDEHGGPISLSVHTPAAGASVAFRATDQDGTDQAWGFALEVKQAEAADDTAARRATADASRTAGTVPTQDEVARQSSAAQVGIAVQADPKGCSRTECGVTVVLTNRSSAPTTGLLVLRADGKPMITKLLDLPARTAARVSVSIPAAVAFAHPNRKVKIEASFATGGVIGDGGRVTV
jgi:hypothetical protein